MQVCHIQVSRTDDYEDANIGAASQYSHMKRHAGKRLPWSPQISQTDMAFAWSKCLAPVYAFNLIGIRAALKYKVSCQIAAFGMHVWSALLSL